MKKILLMIGISLLLTGCQEKGNISSVSGEYNVHLKGKEPTFYPYSNTMDSLAQYHSFEWDEDLSYPSFPNKWYFITTKEEYDAIFKDFPGGSPFLYSEDFFDTYSLVGISDSIRNYATIDQEVMFGIHQVDKTENQVTLTIYQSIIWGVNNNYKNNYLLLGFLDPGKNQDCTYQTDIVYDFYYTDEMLTDNR